MEPTLHTQEPCGTASRTRLIQRFAPDPPIVCTDQHPDGLPHLEGDLAVRVRAPLCTAPNQSFIWDTQAMRSWLQPTLSTPSSIIVSIGQPGHKCIRFVHCLSSLELLTYSGTHVLRSGQDGGRLGHKGGDRLPLAPLQSPRRPCGRGPRAARSWSFVPDACLRTRRPPFKQSVRCPHQSSKAALSGARVQASPAASGPPATASALTTSERSP